MQHLLSWKLEDGVKEVQSQLDISAVVAINTSASAGTLHVTVEGVLKSCCVDSGINCRFINEGF